MSQQSVGGLLVAADAMDDPQRSGDGPDGDADQLAVALGHQHLHTGGGDQVDSLIHRQPVPAGAGRPMVLPEAHDKAEVPMAVRADCAHSVDATRRPLWGIWMTNAGDWSAVAYCIDESVNSSRP